MSSIPYINPLSPVQIGGTISVPRDVNFGVTYSTNLVGGYMEVESLNDLIYTIPSGTSGLTQYSGNSIPISFVKGNGSGYSPDVLFLNNDNISSGRRKIGMMVFVREQSQIYQYNIDGYDTLWDSATAATGTVEISYLGTTVNNTSAAGQNFINAWTASTIDGVGGYTVSTAKWKKYYGTNLTLTGGSFNSITGTLTLTNITGGTQTLTGFGSGGGGSTITGGTFNQSTLGLDLNSTGGTVTINNVTGLYISAGTYNSGTTTLSLFNSTGGTISITGFTSGGGGGGSSNLQYFITGSTPSGVTINSGDRWFDTNTGVEVVYINDGDSSQWVRPSNGVSPLFTGNTSATCITSLYVSNIYGCSPININDLLIANSGLTTTNLTATTISATTYYNLPSQSGTGISSISYTPTNGILTLTKNDTTTLTAGTFTYLTGASYSNNTITLINNLGGNSTVNFSSVTGLTVNGNLTVTGNTSLLATTATTISGDSLILSSSASTIYLDNTTAQQIKFYDGGRGTPSYNSYSAGVKIIFTDNISSNSSGHAIGVDSGSLWYSADLAGNGHDWYGGTNKLMSLISSSGLRLFGLGGPTTTAMVISGTSALGSKGGVGYMDFLQVVNNWSAATNVNKWFRTNITGGLEILNNAYTATILTLSDDGIMAVGGGNPATSTSQDATSNYLTFNNNNTQIYDDGNTHIHSRGTGQSMWINTNGGQLNLLTQSPTATGGIGSGIAIATGTLNGYVTINTGRTVTTAAAYGYLTTGGAGTYPGGSQSVSISLYANNRIWGQEIDAFSDERMKDIHGEITLEEGIKLVKNLKPIKYNWKEGDDKGTKAGYSAQQVIKSGFDHLIGLIPTEGLEETIDDDGFLSPKDTQFAMNYDQVTPYHGVVIKHLLEEIENLKNEIKELKRKIG